MTSAERALAACNELRSLNMELQALVQKAVHDHVTSAELRDLLKKTAHAGYLTARTLDSLQHDADCLRGDRRDTRLPPFDGVEDAQQAAARAVAVPVPVSAGPSLGEQLRKALAGEQA